MWDTLSDWERSEWLAYDAWLLDRFDDISHALIKKEQYTPETYVMLVRETL